MRLPSNRSILRCLWAHAYGSTLFLACFLEHVPTVMLKTTARPAEYAAPGTLKRLRARETTAAAQFAGFFSEFVLLPARSPGLRALQNMPRLPVILTLLHTSRASRRAFSTRCTVRRDLGFGVCLGFRVWGLFRI